MGLFRHRHMDIVDFIAATCTDPHTHIHRSQERVPTDFSSKRWVTRQLSGQATRMAFAASILHHWVLRDPCLHAMVFLASCLAQNTKHSHFFHTMVRVIVICAMFTAVFTPKRRPPHLPHPQTQSRHVCGHFRFEVPHNKTSMAVWRVKDEAKTPHLKRRGFLN